MAEPDLSACPYQVPCASLRSRPSHVGPPVARLTFRLFKTHCFPESTDLADLCSWLVVTFLSARETGWCPPVTGVVESTQRKPRERLSQGPKQSGGAGGCGRESAGPCPHGVVHRTNKWYVTVHLNVCPIYTHAVVRNEIQIIFKEMLSISS